LSLVVAALLAALAGCGSSAHRAASTTLLAPVTTTDASVTTPDASSTTTSPSTTTATTSVSPPSSTTVASPPTSTPAHATAVQLSEGANQTTISVTRGSTITVVLRSTYWTIDPPGGPVLFAAGPQSYAPGQGCGATVPGSGCGTVTLVVRAAAAGTAMLTANRTSCGEALRCTPDQSTWRVTVRVTS